MIGRPQGCDQVVDGALHDTAVGVEQKYIFGSCPHKSEIAGGRETEVCCILDDSKPIILSVRKEIQAAVGRCIINDIDVSDRSRPKHTFYCGC
jgi:hypothetical protein